MKNHNIGSQPTDDMKPVSDNAIVFGYHNNKYGSTAEVVIRSGIVETVDVLANNEWIRISVDSDTSSMYYTLSEYTDTGCVLTINNITVYEISVRVNDNYVVSKFKNYEPAPVPEQLTDYQLRVLELQSQPNVSSGDIIRNGNMVSVKIISGMVEIVEISTNSTEIQRNEWRHLYTKSETNDGMYYQLGDYTDTGCFLYIYNVSTVELYLRINGNYHMMTTNILTDYEKQIQALKSQELRTSGLLVWVNNIVTLNILGGTVKTVELGLGLIDLGAGVGEFYGIDTISVNTTPYYVLSDYTLDGCMLTIYNVPAGDVYLRLNGVINMGAHFLENTPQKK